TLGQTAGLPHWAGDECDCDGLPRQFRVETVTTPDGFVVGAEAFPGIRLDSGATAGRTWPARAVSTAGDAPGESQRVSTIRRLRRSRHSEWLGQSFANRR